MCSHLLSIEASSVADSLRVVLTLAPSGTSADRKAFFSE
jgi:hypothetical protein